MTHHDADPGSINEHPDSPCVRVCALDPEQRYCVGCWRSTTEIAAWGGMSAVEKHATLQRTEQRKALRREQMRELRRLRQLRRKLR